MAYRVPQSAEPRGFPKAASLAAREGGPEHPLLLSTGVQIPNSAVETQRLPKETLSPALKKLNPLLGAFLHVPAAEQ